MTEKHKELFKTVGYNTLSLVVVGILWTLFL